MIKIFNLTVFMLVWVLVTVGFAYLAHIAPGSGVGGTPSMLEFVFGFFTGAFGLGGVMVVVSIGWEE